MTLIVNSSEIEINDNLEIRPSGAKNAILPLMVSKLLVPGNTIFSNAPVDSEDVKTMLAILTNLGLRCSIHRNKIEIDNTGISEINIDSKLAIKTRYSSLLLGALGALGYDFNLPLPGGCHLQEKRPLDIHYNCLENIGYQVNEYSDYIKLSQTGENKSMVTTN